MQESSIITSIDINDFEYPLPNERIAKFPKENRDESKLLIHQEKMIKEDYFNKISTYLPQGSLLVLNNTRVVRARLLFRKPTGAVVEIFCLEPLEPTTEIQLAFQQKGQAIWQCLVGNARRWKSELLTMEVRSGNETIILSAEKSESFAGTFSIKFMWNEELTFAEVLEATGKIPLPPYLHRDAVESDSKTYQTVYAKNDGSVAAPTAGLHFTRQVFECLKNKQIEISSLTLHVGAGTFKPVGQEGLAIHEMHTEQVLVSLQVLKDVLAHSGKVFAVGTTSVRTLESLYWFGVKLENRLNGNFHISQFDPYEDRGFAPLSLEKSFNNILDYMERNSLTVLSGSTQLMIVPGYIFRVINGMVTNFHQPRSTLLLLISAWLGDEWKMVYNYALENDFRFLSYGDSCLFL